MNVECAHEKLKLLFAESANGNQCTVLLYVHNIACACQPSNTFAHLWLESFISECPWTNITIFILFHEYICIYECILFIYFTHTIHL